MKNKEEYTFEDLYNATIRSHGDESALVYFNPERKVLTFREYGEMIDAYAAYFEKVLQDVDKGSWLGMKLPNSHFWFAVMFALQKIGFNLIFIDDSTSDKLLLHFVEQVNMAAIITASETHIDRVTVVNISNIKEIAKETPNNICWSNKMAFCTSGTIGTAKVYVFNAYSVIFSCNNIMKYYFGESGVALRENDDPEKNNLILALPFRHISGFLIVVALWNMGRCLVLPKDKGIFKLIETIKEENIWLLFCVPAMWKAIVRIMNAKYKTCDEKAFKAMLGDNLKIGLSAAAKLDDEMIKVLSESGLHVLNCWGMTETGVCSIGQLSDNKESGYVGSAMNGHTIKVINDDGSVSDNGTGELMLEGNTLFDAIMIDGVEKKRTEPFRTGDVFKYENDRLWFLGRCKSVIVGESGENVYPEEIDDYFGFIADKVISYCTVGYNDEPVMFINPFSIDDFEKSELFEEIVSANKKLPIIKQLTKLFIVKEKLPFTAKGEPARMKLNSEFVKTAGVETILIKGRKV